MQFLLAGWSSIFSTKGFFLKKEQKIKAIILCQSANFAVIWVILRYEFWKMLFVKTLNFVIKRTLCVFATDLLFWPTSTHVPSRSVSFADIWYASIGVLLSFNNRIKPCGFVVTNVYSCTINWNMNYWKNPPYDFFYPNNKLLKKQGALCILFIICSKN